MKERKMFLLGLTLILGSLLLTGSGCNKDKETAPYSLFQTRTIVIKDEGQPIALSLPDGASITIPPGVVPKGATLTIKRLNPALFPELPVWAESVISLYDFHLDGLLQGTVTIRIPIPDTEISLLGHYSNRNWEVIPFRIEDNKDNIAVVEVEDLSIFSWLNVKVEWLTDKIVEFLTLRWLEEKPACKVPNKETIEIDERDTLGFVLGCVPSISNDRAEIIIYNLAPIHLDVFPVEGEAQLERTGIFVSAEHKEGTVIAPRAKGKWEANLPPGKSVTFEAYFSNAAVAALVSDLLPTGKFGRSILESFLFGHNGRRMEWGDVKGFLIIPAFAEAGKTMEELEAKYTLDRGRISFSRKTESLPITCPPEGEPKFALGQEVIATDELRTRESPSLTATIVKTQAKGTSGKVLEGPVCVDNYVWWKVKYQDGVIGWSAENWLEARAITIITPTILTPTPKPETPTPWPEITVTPPPITEIKGKIAFVTDRDGKQEIYLMSGNTANQVNLTNAPANDWDPAWSPDGKKLAFISDRNGEQGIYIMNADGSNVSRVVKDPEATEPTWFPDGSKIAFAGRGLQYGGPSASIYVVDINGQNLRKIAEHTGFPAGGPAVSPDGKQVAYMYGTLKGATLVIIDLEGNILEKFGSFVFPVPDNPAWSPDGKKIAFSLVPFSAWSPSGGFPEHGGIYLVDVNTGEVQQLTEMGQNPSWSKDGKEIVFSWEGEFYILDVNNREVRRITYDENNDWNPAWFAP